MGGLVSVISIQAGDSHITSQSGPGLGDTLDTLTMDK